LVSINGTRITTANYIDLVNSTSISVSRGYFDGTDFIPYNESISMTAVKEYHDPIIKDTVIVKGSNRIGYLCYSDFINKSETDLVKVFANFKRLNVSDVVLDLRYNGGGFVRTSIVLSSLLAPLATIKAKDIYQIQIYNKSATQRRLASGDDLKERFTDTVQTANMDLRRVFVLVSQRSASASEATIIALEPYMDVTIIGTETAGKFVGGSLASPEKVDYYNSIKNWGMYLMMFRYTNKSGTYFTGGLTPDIQASENIANLYPFGDERDPLLGRAIAQITGQPYVAPRTAHILPSLVTDEKLMVKRPLDGKLINTKSLPKLLKQEIQ
jgi:C-terminal processing protease CtpA/Prc